MSSLQKPALDYSTLSSLNPELSVFCNLDIRAFQTVVDGRAMPRLAGPDAPENINIYLELNDLFVQTVSKAYVGDSQNLLQSRGETLYFLEEINLSGTHISNQEVRTVFKTAPHLRKIYLTDCREINAGNLRTLPSRTLLSLEEIALSSTKINNMDLKSLLKAAPHLQKVYLWNCPNIRPGVFRALQPCDLLYLQEIDLSHTKVTNIDLISLFNAAPHLQKIYLHNCPNIDPDVIKREAIPQLSVIFNHYVV